MVRRATKIAAMNHRIALCSNNDVVVDGSTMEMKREAVRWTWAAVEHQTHLSSFLSPAGFAVTENNARPTHRITIRMQHELDFSATAWIYEEFRKSPPRWYKVIGFVDEDHHVMLDCHLVERNDDAKPVEGTLSPARQDVVL